MKDGLFQMNDFIDCSDFVLANSLLPKLKKQWLEELLKDAPTVWFNHWSNGKIGMLATVRLLEHTHIAKLVEIKEIT